MDEMPFCFSLLMAEYVRQEPATGTFTLVGVFDRLTLAVFPAEITVAVFFGVIDGRGRLPIKLQVVDSDDEEGDPVAVVDGEIELRDPLQQFQTSLSIQMRIEHPGVYHVELWASEERLLTRRLTIVEGPKVES